MALMEVKVPDIGDFDDVAVIEVLVKPGDKIAVDQSLITVESDKASMEIPSTAAGVVKELKVEVGSKVKEGSVLLMLEAEGGAAAPAPAASAPASEPAPAPAQAAAPAPVAQAPAPAAAASGPVDVKLPDIGDFKDVAVIEVLVKVGDTVNIGDLIAVLEGAAGAAPSPAPAPASGQAAPAPASASAPATAAPAAASPSASAPAAPAHDPTAAPSGKLPHASPSVRKFARELGVPLDEVKGSGIKGRITQEDIQSFTKAVMSGTATTKAASAARPAGGGGGGAGLDLLPWPKVDFAKFGPVERKDLSRIKKISGANLSRNWVMIPHVTNNDEADITELEAFRVSTNKENEKSGVKVTMLAFVIKAVVAALKKYPEFNASLDGDQLVYKQYFHIGFAADTPNGLVVPVLKDADKKGILQISAEMGELAKKARDGKLGAADMQGGCFSISSLGGIGGTHFTPIINAPEVAILGLSKGAMKPVWDGKQFVPRLTLPLSLSYDHRVIDGASAARFNAYLSQVLADYRRILL
jgi:pyruvate dehydrogenase E2 component (dihydrolipoamide acetyltransferase)